MNTTNSRPNLVWKDEYSVEVIEIDEQHKKLIQIINNLIDAISNTQIKKQIIIETINNLIEYKKMHFETEEKYFHLFNYEGTLEHETAHNAFNERINTFQIKDGDDVISLAFDLVDYLEDWMIGHLMGMDKKYTRCFHEHGLY